jgi:hypothetical protein
MNFFCSPASPKVEQDLTSSVFECDYDKGATTLYQAIESQAWVPVLQFLEEGKWDHMYRKDPNPPGRQVQTWVTRFEENGRVRWSHLPIHAAIIFKAPRKIIVSLLNMYPLGARCTDDQQMLPLHLAFKFGADDTIVTLLLQRFPEALFTKNVRGRLPTDIDGPQKERTDMIREIVKVTTESVSTKQSEFYQEKSRDMKDDLNLQIRLNASLESDKKELEERLSLLQAEVIMLKSENEIWKEKDLLDDLESRILEKSASDLDASIARSLTRSRRRHTDTRKELETIDATNAVSVGSRKSRASRPSRTLERTSSKDVSMGALGRSYSEAKSEKDSTTAVRDALSEGTSIEISSRRRSTSKKKKINNRANRGSKEEATPYLGYISNGNKGMQILEPHQGTRPRKTHGFFQGFGESCE